MTRWMGAAISGWLAAGVCAQPLNQDDAPRAIPAKIAHPILTRTERLLSTRHSYSLALDVPVQEEIARSRRVIGDDEVPPAVLVRELSRLLALSGDGHARAASSAFDTPKEQTALPIACMPLDLEAGGRVVAIESNGERLVDQDHPFLVAIDGVGIERWLAISAETAPGGSAQSRRYGACRGLGDIAWIRERIGIEASNSVRLTLGSPDGGRIELTRALVGSITRGFRKTPLDTLNEPGVTYIPIRRMWNPDAGGQALAQFEAIKRSLDAAENAQGVLIDIRGNTGGVRDLLYLVASYVLLPEDSPVVFWAARALMWDRRDGERVRRSMEGRRLFLSDDPRWQDHERREITAFIEAFEPEVELDDRFGPLHVSMLSPGGRGNGSLAGKPIVVLIDERCISAADIFAAGMKRLPGVTLLGRPTRGASGMSIETDIGYGISLRLSTMVSFMADGRVFDWHGVDPDVEVELTPEDFTRDGTDTALERALQLLKLRMRE